VAVAGAGGTAGTGAGGRTAATGAGSGIQAVQAQQRSRIRRNVEPALWAVWAFLLALAFVLCDRGDTSSPSGIQARDVYFDIVWFLLVAPTVRALPGWVKSSSLKIVRRVRSGRLLGFLCIAIAAAFFAGSAEFAQLFTLIPRPVGEPFVQSPWTTALVVAMNAAACAGVLTLQVPLWQERLQRRNAS
jgi:hypothetical protein